MQGMLSAAQLASFQSFAAQVALDLTANTTRNTGTGANVWGTPNETWTAVLTGVACNLAKPTATQEKVYANLIADQAAWFVSFATGSDVLADDRVIVSGKTLRVQAVFEPQSYSWLTQALCVETGKVIS